MVNGSIGERLLHTVGESVKCIENPVVSLQELDITFNPDNKTVAFTIAGTSVRELNVTGTLNLDVYGINVLANPLDPCDPENFVKELCPSKP